MEAIGMFFTVVNNQAEIDFSLPGRAYLQRDDWDDWFKFETTFNLIVVDHGLHFSMPGLVKIGRFGLRGGQIAPEERRPGIPDEFDELDERFFSVGQGENYYETIRELEQNFGDRILAALRDCAWDLELFERARGEFVMGESLLRSVRASSVVGRYNQILQGV